MSQLDRIEAIEARLWRAADLLRSNSELASNEYFMPVMGLIFLRHAYSRFLAVKPEIEKSLPSRQGITRALTKEDFSQKGSIFLRPEAQFDYFISRASDPKLPAIVIHAMETIEDDYTGLKGVLPKQEYQSIPADLLGDLVRTLNPEELKTATGDVFGRIYGYFLTKFADLKAHDGGEFFTPISLVQFIANVLEPASGTVLDPACGSGGMFVQSARIVEQRHQNPSQRLTFRGYEKNKTTVNLAKMNLAVHGLEGDIQQNITYYDDPLNLLHKCDYVMANPPFNVDEVDAKIANDPRLPFGLPGVTTAKGKKNGDEKGKGRVQNGNYLWIQYFYSYLNAQGRAGFVMSSQASSAGRDEAKVRQSLVKSGHVDVMVAIRSNFFYTRTVPCELWFLNKAKPAAHQDKVLMLDARGVYRKVTRKIYDFSPEQLQNLLSIVWVYRGEGQRFRALVAGYLKGDEGHGGDEEEVDPTRPTEELLEALGEAIGMVRLFLTDRGASLDDIQSLTGFARNAAIVKAKEAANESDESRKRFEILCQTVFSKFKACFGDDRQHGFRADRDAIDIIYKSLQDDKQHADISEIIQRLHAVVDEAIETRTPVRDDGRIYDISQIDFERLRQEFQRTAAPNTTVQNLRAAIESRLRRMIAQNPLRTDFQEHYHQIVWEYNQEKDRVTIERTFEELLRFVNELDEEQRRALREGLDQESLVLYDLLVKPKLTPKEIGQIKQVAVELLSTLKEERLRVDQWRDKEGTRDAVRSAIFDFLYSDKTGLPTAYSEDEIKDRSEKVFQHVFYAYPTVPSPIYAYPEAH